MSGIAVGALVLGVGATAAEASTTSEYTRIGATAPHFMETGLHPVMFDVDAVYVHDDGDPGVYGQGDFQTIKLKVAGALDNLYVSNLQTWKQTAFDYAYQEYNSDHNYPTHYITGYNRYYGTAKVGATLNVPGWATELDMLTKNATVATGSTKMTIPAVGHHADYTVELEGTNGKSHVRLTLTVRVSTQS